MKYLNLLLALLLPAALVTPSAQAGGSDRTGFLVIAPDRGFKGNEETQDAFDSYKKEFNAALAIIGRNGADRFLSEGLSQLVHEGAEEIVVLPLFLSRRHPMLRHAVRRLSSLQANSQKFHGPTILLDGVLGEHYLAEEILADRIAKVSKNPSQEFLILAAHGSPNAEDNAAIGADMKRVLLSLHDRYPFAGSGVAVVPGMSVFDGPIGRPDKSLLVRRVGSLLTEARSKGLRPILIPYGLTTKLDAMMSFSSYIGSLARKSEAIYDGRDWTPHPNVALWLSQRSNTRLPVSASNLGVVYMPHGATHLWNRTMIDALQDLPRRYRIEPAFGMGDPSTIRRAITKLENRGATAITVLRVFSLESSFRPEIERALGLGGGEHRHGHSHGHRPPAAPIRSGSALYTTGGIGHSPLFARALLDRAMELSRDPRSETVIVVGHGGGDERSQRQWNDHLAGLVNAMKGRAEKLGVRFRGFEYGTWREDWPRHKEKAVKDVRRKVRKASASGRAIVIPARTTYGGPGAVLLKGLDFAYDGKGFAPHPAYAEWVQGQIDASLEHFRAQRLKGLTPLSEGT